MTSTRSTLHSISTTPLTSPHAFVHVILIKIHFSLHFQSASECIPIPYYTVRPPKDLPDPCSLVCTCTYGLRRLTGRGTCTSNMYFQTIPPNSPPGSSCWKRNFPPGIQKDFFEGFLNWWPRRIFLGMSGMYAFIGCALSDGRRCRHTYCTYLGRYIHSSAAPAGIVTNIFTIFSFRVGY